MRSLLMIPVVLTFLDPAPLHAQRLPAPFPAPQAQQAKLPQGIFVTGQVGSPAGAVVSGLAVGTVGLLAGAMIGVSLAPSCYCDEPGLKGLAYGALAGETAGLALGTHLGDDLKGNLALDLVASAAGTLITVAAASGAQDGNLLLPGVALQVALVAGTELGMARRKARRR